MWYFLLAVAVNIVYWTGVRMLAPAPYGTALGLLWGAALAAVLVVQARVVLHIAILEAAVEAAAEERRSKWATTDVGYCAECEHRLLPDSVFCIVCGSSARATTNAARNAARSHPPDDDVGDAQ